MSREMSIARRTDRIAASSSSSISHNHESLGVDQDQTPETQTSTHDAGSSNVMPLRRRGSLYNEFHLLRSTRLRGRTTFQCKFVFP
jgi:hypothetical protein